MEAYCMKCKTRREINDPRADFNARGSPVTIGTCPVCGTRLYRMGRTEAHEGLTPPPRTPREPKREGKLVIVESPAKAKTVGRILGRGYTVKASIGHVRDLLRSQLSVDVDNNFEPKYRVPNEKRGVVKELRKLARSSKAVFLATDPDREGESISWHLIEASEMDPALAHRVTFHEITAPAVTAAFENPRAIDMDLVNAQQARRILDRLVGYSISPILWEKVRSRLSAGRVQSVALRLIVDREREIESFIAREYWTVHAEFRPQGSNATFLSKLTKIDGQDVDIPDHAAAASVAQALGSAVYDVGKLRRSERRRKAPAPFTTSTLQQEASRKLGYPARRTMALAQALYEGQDVGSGGSTGLITYMRTDSPHVAAPAQAESREFIAERYGREYVPEVAPVHRSKSSTAQEAHEAIRPTSVLREPESIKGFLEPAQLKLYSLIWQRFVASQMEAATYDTVQVEVVGRGSGREYLLRASGSSLRFQGFLAVYEEARREDGAADDEEENVKIPAEIAEGQAQNLVRVDPRQHFTQPPPRLSEASLVQMLEENGIGRPSTYAPIISTIQQRGYVYRSERRLVPTQIGFQVNDLIVEYFPEVVDVNFTAQMEADLDRVAAGEMQWTAALREFYEPFKELVMKAQAEIPITKTGPEPIGRQCPEDGGELVVRYGRYGKFISCGNFPSCRYTEPWLEKIGVSCPKDGGDVVERRTRKGRTFYGCSNYPTCDFTSWKRPVPSPCPNCGGLLVISNKRQLQCTSCENLYPVEDLVPEATPE